MFKQGLAWIDSKNHQILRLTSDLLRPLHQVKLEKVTTEIAFSEVSFHQKPRGLWLPNEVTVTIDWNGRVLRNKHQYSEFLMFTVDSTDRVGKPKEVQ